MKTKLHLFRCSCEGSKDVSFDEFKKHLAEVHKLTTKEDLQGKKQMKMHMDMRKSFSSTYEWTLNNGLTFLEFYEGSRSKKDMMF